MPADASAASGDDLGALSAGLAAADVVDALAKIVNHRAHITGLVGPSGNATIMGPAATVSFLPRRADVMDPRKHSLGPAIYRATAGRDPAGAILVMASNGHPGISLGGSTKLSRVRNLGMSGVVCDGLLRDFDELAAYPFSSYCTGEAIRGGGNEIQPFLADVPVSIAGVTVVPGDWVFADPTGVAIIPAGREGEVLSMAHQIKQMAQGMLEVIATEDPASVMKSGSKEM